MDVKELVKGNLRRFPSLKAGAQLVKGTNLEMPASYVPEPVEVSDDDAAALGAAAAARPALRSPTWGGLGPHATAARALAHARHARR